MATRRKQNKFISIMNNKDKEDSNQSKLHLDGDGVNILLLFFLYTLQGIPLGLSYAIPMILQNKGVSYKQQAEFSLVAWPFSLKLFWAPIVDSMFIKQIGRRKSWLIPTQYLLGLFMLILSSNIDTWLGKEDEEPQIKMLTILFLILNFLAATQDIAVDGWALTMLKKKNVTYASTCNSVGQTFGYFCGYVLFLALESPEICNYFRLEPSNKGFVTLAGFFYFWGLTFFITTTIIAIIKKESEYTDPEYEHVHEEGLRTAYSFLVSIVKLPAIQTLALVLLTCKIGFSATDSVFSLKLIESGIPREKLGLLAIPLIPVQLVLPIIISKYTRGPQPMDVYMKYVPYRLMFGLLAAGIVYITPIIVKNHEVPMYYYGLLILCYCLHQICVYSMFVAVMAFFNRVSDPTVGGTYMTLLNTLSNLGGNWPQTLALWFIDPLTYKNCVSTKKKYFVSFNYEQNTCKDHLEIEECQSNGGKCVTIMDGFYIETIICVLIGFAWLFWGIKKIKMLQQLSEKSWRIHKAKSNRLWLGSANLRKPMRDLNVIDLKRSYNPAVESKQSNGTMEPKKKRISNSEIGKFSDISDDRSDTSTNSLTSGKNKFNFKSLCTNTMDRIKLYKTKHQMKSKTSNEFENFDKKFGGELGKNASDIISSYRNRKKVDDQSDDSESSSKSCDPDCKVLKKKKFYHFFLSNPEIVNIKDIHEDTPKPEGVKPKKKDESVRRSKQLIPKKKLIDLTGNSSVYSVTSEDEFDYKNYDFKGRYSDGFASKTGHDILKDKLMIINNICEIKKLQDTKYNPGMVQVDAKSSSRLYPSVKNSKKTCEIKIKNSFSDTDIAVSFSTLTVKNYFKNNDKYIQCEKQSSVDTGIQVCLKGSNLLHKNTDSSDLHSDDSEYKTNKKSLLYKMINSKNELAEKIFNGRHKKKISKKQSEIKILHPYGRKLMTSSTSMIKPSILLNGNNSNKSKNGGPSVKKRYTELNSSSKIVRKVLKPTTIVFTFKKNRSELSLNHKRK